MTTQLGHDLSIETSVDEEAVSDEYSECISQFRALTFCQWGTQHVAERCSARISLYGMLWPYCLK